MKKFTGRRERIVAVIGGSLLLIGFICNEWVLTKLLSSDGVLNFENRVLIWISEILLIGFGILLICIREDTKKQMNLMVFCATTILCIVLAESIYFVLQKKSRVRILVKNPHGTGSYRLKPDTEYTYKHGKYEFHIKTNSLGMRGKEVSYDNPLYKKRVAFVGDSFTFGSSASKGEKSFVGVVESLLDRRKFEVLNFGVGGYGLSDMELQIKEEVLKFRPSYLILVFYNGNDFRDTYLGIDKFDVSKDFSEWDYDNFNKKIPGGCRQNLFFRKFTKTLTYQLMARGLNLARPGVIEKKKYVGLNFEVDKFFTSHSYWSQYPYPEEALKAKERSLEVLDNIRKICLNNNIEFMIVALPYKEQIFAASVSGENYDLNYPQKYVEQFASKYSIPYLDLLPSMRTFAREEKRDIYVTSHFNDVGHSAVGKVICEFFRNKIGINKRYF